MESTGDRNRQVTGRRFMGKKAALIAGLVLALFLALGIALAIGYWLGSGTLPGVLNPEEPPATLPQSAAGEPPLVPIPPWPPLTIRYEVVALTNTGQGNKPVTVNEVLVTYNGAGDWQEEWSNFTLLDSEWAGAREYEGFRVVVKDGVLTTGGPATYDSHTGPAPSHARAPSLAWHAPAPLEELRQRHGEPTWEPTETLLCFDDECVANAWGWRFQGELRDAIYADDRRSIPINLYTTTITEVRVSGPQQPTGWK